MKEFYTTGEVAQLLGTHPDTVRKYCDSGELEAEKGLLSTHRRIKPESLQKFLENRGIASKEIIESVISKRVMIVDDEKALHKIIMNKLNMLDFPFEFEYASNGHEACVKIGLNKPDLVILDLMMPEMDGLQVIENIKKVEALKDTPILLVSGYFNEENIEKARVLGVSDILNKPLVDDALLEKVKTLLKLEFYNNLIKN